MKHSFSVKWSEEDQEYIGLCAEFPSLSWLEETPDAALTGIQQLVSLIQTHDLSEQVAILGEMLQEKT